MTPPRDVFLLGAGFARAISPEMPLLQDLADRVLATEAVRAKIPPEIVAMMHDNFAHALSYLEQAKPWISEADNLRHRALYLECSHAIARDLDATVRRVASRLAARIPPWLQQLLRAWHTQRSVVLTLNYDTLVETLVATLRLSGGRLTAQQLYPPLLTDAALRATGDRRPPRAADVSPAQAARLDELVLLGTTPGAGRTDLLRPSPAPARRAGA